MKHSATIDRDENGVRVVESPEMIWVGVLTIVIISLVIWIVLRTRQ